MKRHWCESEFLKADLLRNVYDARNHETENAVGSYTWNRREIILGCFTINETTLQNALARCTRDDLKCKIRWPEYVTPSRSGFSLRYVYTFQ